MMVGEARTWGVGRLDGDEVGAQLVDVELTVAQAGAPRHEPIANRQEFGWVVHVLESHVPVVGRHNELREFAYIGHPAHSRVSQHAQRPTQRDY